MRTKRKGTKKRVTRKRGGVGFPTIAQTINTHQKNLADIDIQIAQKKKQYDSLANQMLKYRHATMNRVVNEQGRHRILFNYPHHGYDPHYSNASEKYEKLKDELVALYMKKVAILNTRRIGAPLNRDVPFHAENHPYHNIEPNIPR